MEGSKFDDYHIRVKQLKYAMSNIKNIASTPDAIREVLSDAENMYKECEPDSSKLVLEVLIDECNQLLGNWDGNK